MKFIFRFIVIIIHRLEMISMIKCMRFSNFKQLPLNESVDFKTDELDPRILCFDQ